MGICLGSDNGLIWQRTGANSYAVVHALSTADYTYRSGPIGFSGVGPDTPNVISTFANFDLTAPLVSTDQGATWSEGAAPTVPSGFLGPFTWAKIGNGANWTINNDGRVYVYGPEENPTPVNHAVWLFYAPGDDLTAWTQGAQGSENADDSLAISFPNLATNLQGVVIMDGWLWWIRSTGNDLRRESLAMDAFALSTMPNHPNDPGDTTPWVTYSMHSHYGTQRLVAWEPQSDNVILTVDVSNPASPSYTTSVNQPFGAGHVAHDLIPLSNSVILAVVVDSSDWLSGSIWRSTDAGATWSAVVSNTTNLGIAPDAGHLGFDNAISAVAVDPSTADNVAVALCPPYVYLSDDGGLTWSVETADLSLADPYGGDRPYEWTGIVWAAPGDGGEEPTPRRRRSFSWNSSGWMAAIVSAALEVLRCSR